LKVGIPTNPLPARRASLAGAPDTLFDCSFNAKNGDLSRASGGYFRVTKSLVFCLAPLFD
jgi:hypothetical protein